MADTNFVQMLKYHLLWVNGDRNSGWVCYITYEIIIKCCNNGVL